MGRAPNDGKSRTPSLDQASLSTIERYGGKRGQRLLALVAAGQLAAPAVKWTVERVNRREDFTITVAGIDNVYADLHEWVLERIPEMERKALIATTSQDSFAQPVAHDEQPPSRRRRVRLRYDGSRVQSVELDGYKVRVSVQREEIPGGRSSLPENWRQLTEKITFTAASSGGRDAIVKMIDGLVAAHELEKKPPALMIPSRWGGSWNMKGDLPPRPLDSVILKDGQLERLIGDLDRFLKREHAYSRKGQPWHRGYLFHGEPGTGKTSVARALANHFDMPTYYLPLGDLEKDADLMGLVSSIEPRSVLLMEDIDAFHAATKRKDKAGTASVAAMLNALDGVWTPHGLVTIMTTNNRKVLDPALIRAGRVDVDEEFTALDESQARRIVEWCKDDGNADRKLARKFEHQSPAALIEAVR